MITWLNFSLLLEVNDFPWLYTIDLSGFSKLLLKEQKGGQNPNIIPLPQGGFSLSVWIVYLAG